MASPKLELIGSTESGKIDDEAANRERLAEAHILSAARGCGYQDGDDLDAFVTILERAACSEGGRR
jgi:hypothetical protein